MYIFIYFVLSRGGYRNLSLIDINKTCLIEAGLTKWKWVTESWTIGFDTGSK